MILADGPYYNDGVMVAIFNSTSKMIFKARYCEEVW